MQYTAYISSQCPNCNRFVESVRASPQAQKDIRLVDIDTLQAPQRNKLTAVPTVQTAEGKMFVGSKAFDLLKKYEGDIELHPWMPEGSLVFSEVAGGDGGAKQISFWGDFTPEK